MKIGITGHTRGIGHAISECLTKDGHDLSGYSRSNGYDLAESDHRARLLDQAVHCDVFVNNAFPGPDCAHHSESWAPIEILYDLHRAWRGHRDKIIVVVGSEIQNHPMLRDHPYQIHKMALRLACHQLRAAAKYPRIIMIAPGATDTDQNRHKDWIKMHSDEVAQVVKFCIDNLDRIYVNEIIFTPGRDYQR